MLKSGACQRPVLELTPASGLGCGFRFRASGDGTWTGLGGYYTGETLRLVPAANGVPGHLDLGTFVSTREPYSPRRRRLRATAASSALDSAEGEALDESVEKDVVQQGYRHGDEERRGHE